jgi:hypothetical protein
VRLDEAVRHGPGNGHAVDPAGEDVARGRHPRDVEGSRRLEARVDAVHAAKSEVHDGAPARCQNHPRRLRGEYGLQVDLVHQERLRELRFRQWRADLQQRLVREHWRALSHRPHLAREAQGAEPLEEGRLELRPGAEIVQRVDAERERLEPGERILEAAREQEVARGRQPPHEQREDRLIEHRFPPVRLHHRQLVRAEPGTRAVMGSRHDDHRADGIVAEDSPRA